jgi:putative oxidoreductase
MTTPLLLESAGGFLAACTALWLLALRKFPSIEFGPLLSKVYPFLNTYFLKQNFTASLGLLLLRIAVGIMMIHHGQEKLADPQQFANTYVASLHLPFPLFFAYAAGLSELIGSWLLITGVFVPLGALAITSTMAVAAYQHILTGGFNIYVLELVTLYLGSSISLLLVGPGLFSFDALITKNITPPVAHIYDANDELDTNNCDPIFVEIDNK